MYLCHALSFSDSFSSTLIPQLGNSSRDGEIKAFIKSFTHARDSRLRFIISPEPFIAYYLATLLSSLLVIETRFVFTIIWG